MIFTLRMALEVARAKHVPLYALFVDLMKAYDSVSRAGMWQIMQRKGVPDHLVVLVQQFYESKQAQVFAEGVLSEAFELTAGLGQACCLAPLLFNVFLSAVMEGWEQLSPDKLQFHYRLDGILRRHMDEGSLNKYATWESLLLHDLGYADDAAFLTDTYDKLVVLSLNLQRHYSNWGLTMSVEKTEILLTEGPNPDPIQVQEVDGCDRLHFCSDFKYLGSKIERQPGCLGDITYRLDKARKAFWSLTKHIWDVKQISLQVKIQVYRACVLSVLLYGAESWTTAFSCRKKMETFHMKCLRKICKVTIWDQENWHMNNLVLQQFLGVPAIKQLVTRARLRWLGHLARMPSERLPKQMLFAFLPGDVGTPNQAGRRSGKWLSYEQVNDLESVHVPLHAWMHIARKNQGSDWREIVNKAAPWFTQQQPTGRSVPPTRDMASKTKMQPHQKKKPFWEIALLKQAELDNLEPESGFLRRELRSGGEEALRVELSRWFYQELGADWWSYDVRVRDLLDALAGDEEWGEFFVLDVDVGLYLSCINTVKHTFMQQTPVGQAGPPDGMVRRRLRNKQPRPPAFPEPAPQVVEPPPAAPLLLVDTAAHGVRAPKSRPQPRMWKGRFVRPVFNVHSVHAFLPDRPNAHNTTLDHVVNSSALTCLHCKCVFPEEPMLRLRMAEQHEIPEDIFPAPCPLCVARGDADPAYITNVLTFKRRRTHEHLGDHTVLVWEMQQS